MIAALFENTLVADVQAYTSGVMRIYDYNGQRNSRNNMVRIIGTTADARVSDMIEAVFKQHGG